MRFRRERADFAFAFYAKNVDAGILQRACRCALAHRRVAWRRSGRPLPERAVAGALCIDRLSDGMGRRQGRRHDGDPAVGDEIDFWRVFAVEPGHRLTLLAEMKLPGTAMVEYEVRALDEQRSPRVVTAYSHPAGAPGLANWRALAPVHVLMFPGMAHALAASAAVSAHAGTPPSSHSGSRSDSRSQSSGPKPPEARGRQWPASVFAQRLQPGAQRSRVQQAHVGVDKLTLGVVEQRRGQAARRNGHAHGAAGVQPDVAQRQRFTF